MLRQRVITALVLGAAVLWGVLQLPAAGFGLALLLILCIGAWEWGRMLDLRVPLRAAYCAGVAGLILLCWYFLDGVAGGVLAVLGIAFLYWIAVVFWLRSFSAQPQKKDTVVLLLLAGCVVLVAPWVALTTLRHGSDSGALYVLYFIALVAAADIGAFFCRPPLGAA